MDTNRQVVGLIRNKKGQISKRASGQSYCGPTSLTVLTGKRYDIVEKDLLKEVNKNVKYRGTWRLNWWTGEREKFIPAKKTTQIKGMSNGQMRQALKRYGYRMFRSDNHGANQTFRQWTRATHGKRGKTWYLVVAGNHYMVVKGNKVWDTSTPEKGTPITKISWMKRARMQELFVVERIK